jgi:tRNA modification GTPase
LHALTEHLKNSYGEQIREGFSVVILGEPNVGKSSFLNHIANREVAIVSEIAGTTRDMLEVTLDIQGHKIVFVDTAGLTQTPKDAIEEEGIKRAQKRAEKADLKVVILSAEDLKIPQGIESDEKTILLVNKIDKVSVQASYGLGENFFPISVKEKMGIDAVLNHIGNFVSHLNKEAIPLTRVRHRSALEKVLYFLDQALMEEEIGLQTESLRLAVYELGRITGHVDVEDLLDVIFSDFCIGK